MKTGKKFESSLYRIVEFQFYVVIYFSLFIHSPLKGEPLLYINEILASNTSGIQDESGQFEDWLEIYNAGVSDIKLNEYYLTDDPDNLTRWHFKEFGADIIIPAHGYLLIWCDGDVTPDALHASFKLAREGEWIALVEDDGRTIIDSLTYREQSANVSYGRSPDGSSSFLYFTSPTPNASNPSHIIGSLAKPVISVPSGIYGNQQLVAISTKDSGTTILYTLDGSLPKEEEIGETTFAYSSPIHVTNTTTIRAKTIAENYISSPIATSILFINPPHNLPIMSIVTDPDNLFDENTGIYPNWDKSGNEWERDIIATFFDKNQIQFSIPAGIRIQGNSSRKREKKSFRLYFRDSYGAAQLDYSLFKQTKIKSFKNLVLRAGYDDDVRMETGTLLRDPLATELYRRLNYPVSHSFYVVLYLNNEYWGIYDLRESVNEFFIKDYYGYSDFDIIRMRSGSWELDYGDSYGWQNFLDFVRNNSFESENMYEECARRLDIENFTTMLVMSHATQYRSWTYGAFFIRERSKDARWKVTIWDMDRALTDINWNGFYYYENNVKEYWINIITKKLMENASYRRYFINRLTDLLNTTFSPYYSKTILDSLIQQIELEIPREVARWGTISTERWFDNCDFLRDFLDQRPDIVRYHMEEYFDLSAPVRIKLNSNSEYGSLHLNSMIINAFPWEGLYYENNKIKITACPEPGYQFTSWKNIFLPQSFTIEVNPYEGMVIEAEFNPIENIIVINEIMFSQTDAWACGDWIELYNPSQQSVNMTGWTIRDDLDSHSYMIPDNTIIPTNGYLILCQHKEDFLQYYSKKLNVIGDLEFGLSQEDQVRIYNQNGQLVDRVAYGPQFPWPEDPLFGAASLALIDFHKDNNNPNNWATNYDYGSPGCQNILTAINQKQFHSQLKKFTLEQNYPNPFNSTTTISYAIPQNSHVTIDIFDIRGRKVNTLVNAYHSPGIYEIEWTSTGCASGLYFCRLTAENFTDTKKLIVQK